MICSSIILKWRYRLSELLVSNYPPLKTKHVSFFDRFYSLLGKASFLKIGIGYISQDSIADLEQVIIQNNNIPRLELVIGMHHFQGFERPQLKAVRHLGAYLTDNNIGNIYISTQIPYHGKIYCFADKNNQIISGIIGSNNLSSIVKSTNRIYETAVDLGNQPVVNDLNIFLDELIQKSKPIAELSDEETCIIQSHAPLSNLHGVQKIDQSTLSRCIQHLTNTNFRIPLKADPERHSKSNLNVYFGKGRLNKSTGITLPRPWYEVEIIVPSEITRRPDYPNQKTNDGIITVITDDGWKFDCVVNGDYNKNFRSSDGLTILGRWIKGRLENEGLLIPGEAITNSILDEYGKRYIELTKADIDNVWYLDFSR